MMRTVDEASCSAPPEVVWPHACQVERWPDILPHYRWVTRHRGNPGGDGIVEMAAWRHFGPLPWPTWWESEMWVDPARYEIRYRHVRGITSEMDVLWTITPDDRGGSTVRIVHEWAGPGWPVIGRAAAELVIGPVFVHAIATRTLQGVTRAAERSA